MSKPFFYRITAADFLAAVVTVPEADRAAWVLSLALDMVSGERDTAKSQFAKDIITEAGEYKERRANAGRKGGVAKASNAKQCLAKPSLPLARSSSSNRSKYKGDFESIWKLYPNKAGKTLAQRKFNSTVTSEEDEVNIAIGLKTYLAHLKAETWKKPQNGGTWFGQWMDWVDYEHVDSGNDDLTPQQRQIKATGTAY